MRVRYIGKDKNGMWGFDPAETVSPKNKNIRKLSAE